MPEFSEQKLGKGAVKDILDQRDLKYEEILGAFVPFTDEDFAKGFDIEKKLNFKLPIKNQQSSLSCVGQAYSYYTAILNLVETGIYDEVSAKAIYSQIFLPQGGAMFRDGAKLLVDFGALPEVSVPSKDERGLAREEFVRDKNWMTPESIQMAKTLQSKDYRAISGCTIDIFAQAIRDNYGVVGGVSGTNNGTWSSNEPKPPTGHATWGHALYFGKFGIDEKGKYISTPNSWGNRNMKDSAHPDDWQKLREDWFAENGKYIFSPWTLTDKPNILNIISMDIKQFLVKNDLKFFNVKEVGTMGRIMQGKVKVANTKDRSVLMLIDNEVRKNGVQLLKSEFEELEKAKVVVNF
jgi:hypothetical protein